MSRVLPILFNTDMVRAILDGRKTVTRRLVRDGISFPGYYGRDKFYGVVDHLNNDYKNWYAGFYNDNDVFTDSDGNEKIDAIYFKAPYKPGDILYVRETWSEWTDGYLYKAWTSPFPQPGEASVMKWHTSIRMPKEAARIWLKVKDVRVERLQEITANEKAKEGLVPPCCMCRNEEDGKCEGGDRLLKDCPIECINYSFMKLWNSTIKKSDLDRYGWDANPWVWVIEFERVEKGAWA